MASISFRKVTVEALGQLTQVVQERMGHYYLVFTLRCTRPYYQGGRRRLPISMRLPRGPRQMDTTKITWGSRYGNVGRREVRLDIVNGEQTASFFDPKSQEDEPHSTAVTGSREPEHPHRRPSSTSALDRVKSLRLRVVS
jgi:hypothetical protein